MTTDATAILPGVLLENSWLQADLTGFSEMQGSVIFEGGSMDVLCKRPTNPFLPGSVVRRPVFSRFLIPHGVCLMVRLEQVWRERISWLQSSGLTVVDQAAGLTPALPDARLRAARRRSPVCK
jgi:hypothetical protein